MRLPRVSGLLVYTIVVFLFLFAPIAMVVLFSFNKTAGLTFPFHGFSLRWYRAVFESPTYRDSIVASLRVAAVTVVVVVIVGTLAGIGVTRHAFSGNAIVPINNSTWGQ